VKRRRVSHHLPLRALPAWLGDQLNDRGGLIILAIAALTLALLVTLVPRTVARGPQATTRVEGRIVGVGFVDIEGRGSVAEASIEVEGVSLRIEIPTRLDCRVGDPVALERVATRNGPYFRLSLVPNPCGAPFRH
jgi:hypothetical protein